MENFTIDEQKTAAFSKTLTVIIVIIIVLALSYYIATSLFYEEAMKLTKI